MSDSNSVGDWFDFMPDTVTIRAWTGQTTAGVQSYNPVGVEYAARIEMKNHKILSREGDEILAKGKVFLGTTTVPSVKDLLTLPARYVPTTPPILDAYPVSDEIGIHHVTLEIG